MATFCVEIHPRSEATAGGDPTLLHALRDAGLSAATGVWVIRLYSLDGDLNAAAVETVASRLLVDPVTERAVIRAEGAAAADPAGALTIEVHLRPGVMDPVAETTCGELRAAGVRVDAVRTARRYVVRGAFSSQALRVAAARVLANDCIEELIDGAAPVRAARQPPVHAFAPRRVPLADEADAGLERLSRSGHLFLTIAEMRAIQTHFAALKRDPTDLELETLAQTWSEHCVHKTLRSAYVYRGAALPGEPARTELRFSNLLKDTIARATEELMAAGRGPRCLSVFKDNAGIIAFDDEFGVAFKVETHNHPSAIEPYGGAATGVGGCIRDILGCGLAARPIANTDVFCVAPAEWPIADLPQGVLHPWRVLRGVVQGVADYGNRMGIPTVNGAVCVDPRYLGNPLVFCGCVGLIPVDRIEKAAHAGDLIVLIGGRTGRDGIHGATFSSAELTDTHADEFSHAVQIGNAITEKRVQDAVLAARDAASGCLFTAITDCGAGGLSSAIGEMAAAVGATVDLDRVPLKYSGLRYDEIWVSEAQERMVLAVPIGRLEALMAIMRDEEVEATVIGAFGAFGDEHTLGYPQRPRLIVRFAGTVVGDLDMEFLHHGLPMREREATWTPAPSAPAAALTADTPQVTAAIALEPHHGTHPAAARVIDELLQRLGAANAASREWIIRKYDHEVQGGSVIKPLFGPGGGPSDAAVLRPRLDSRHGIAIGCGLAPELADVDPYWMAVVAIDEALRNVVAVGGDPQRTAILDNFCWGRSDDAENLGALVRACRGCYDAAIAFGTPFISGKDSLNNEYLLGERDREPLIRALHGYAREGGVSATHLREHLPDIEQRIRAIGRLRIPHTLLISAVALVDDVARCVSADLKAADNELLLLGGQPPTALDLAAAARTHGATAAAIRAGIVRACHDASDGGWLAALAEMCIGGRRGATISAGVGAGFDGLSHLAGGYVIETHRGDALRQYCREHDVPCRALGATRADGWLRLGDHSVAVSKLRAAWAEARGGACSPGSPPETLDAAAD